MGEVYREEVASLQREFDWILAEEVPTVLSQLEAAVVSCAQRFPVQVGDIEREGFVAPSQTASQGDKYLLTSSDQVKVVVSLSGDTITAADINLKLPRPHSKDAYHNTSVREEVPWVLQQVQDSANFLHKVWHLLSMKKSDNFLSGGEVTHLLSEVSAPVPRHSVSLSSRCSSSCRGPGALSCSPRRGAWRNWSVVRTLRP